MQAAESPASFKREPAIAAQDRRDINDVLAKERPGHVCAVLYPAGRRGQVVSSPELITVKLPRNTRRPPRRGVHIPISKFERARLEKLRLAAEMARLTKIMMGGASF